MPEPRICLTIVEKETGPYKAVEPLVDLFEVRLDLIGPSWPEAAHGLAKPWIACNRSPEEGGKGHPDEMIRFEELLRALDAGASIVDIELNSKNLAQFVPLIKTRAKCLISFHNILETPAGNVLQDIIRRQKEAGADICKVVTTAQKFEDNTRVLKLIRQFPDTKVVAFAMGEAGKISRILSPLAGAYFTYACLSTGKESASGQAPVQELYDLYRAVGSITR